MDTDLAATVAKWPNNIDPHRCGTAPFVPNVDGPEQHSCGTYKASFGPNGCSRYRPNYPDDQYIQQHGCEGLKDCYNGATPDQPKKWVPPGNWPATGFVPGSAAECDGCDVLIEGFESGCSNALFTGVIWLALLFVIFKTVSRLR